MTQKDLDFMFEVIRPLSDENFFPLHDHLSRLQQDHWDELKWIEENIKYQKPIYNPYEIFTPSKAFIKDILKQLRGRAYVLLNEITKFKQMGPIGEWLLEERQLEHRKIEQRIRGYNSYLAGSIKTQQRLDTDRAKQRPISDFFPTQLRKAGSGRMMGICPFHSESSPSFVYYVTQNSFNCYGCSANGDVIDFVMKLNGLDFVKATKLILNQ